MGGEATRDLSELERWVKVIGNTYRTVPLLSLGHGAIANHVQSTSILPFEFCKCTAQHDSLGQQIRREQTCLSIAKMVLPIESLFL